MTKDQRRAVETIAGDLAITAGAGSGKTTVLAERFTHALMPAAGGEGPFSEIDRVLTITFTNKAAAEIAERIRRLLLDEVGVEEGRRIDEAWISTIHSFCARLVRRHVLEAGVDPYFTLLDDVATSALKTEAFERAARRLYGSDQQVTSAIDAFSVEQLRERVTSCHDNARALGLDSRRVVVQRGAQAVEPLALEVRRLAEELSFALGAAKQTPSVCEKREQLRLWQGLFGACSLSDGEACERLLALADACDVRRPPEGAKAESEALKDALSRMRSVALSVVHDEVLAGLETLMREFAEVFSAIKAQRSLLDFDDLQERAVSLLEGNPGIAARYRHHFDLIMVDEFQDTNELQLRVLAPIRNDNLCAVGDERQSIYGFRYAEARLMSEFAAGVSQRVPLSANFRSHPGVLGFVNAAFAMPHLFGASFMRLEARRVAGWRTPLQNEPRVEIALVDSGQNAKARGRAAEAAQIGERIGELISSGVSGGDIAVLLRAATNARLYAEALEGRGVPVHVNAGARLMDAPEVEDVMALLRVIAVPADDQALMMVLSGRLVGLSDDALLAIRRAADRDSLFAGLQALAAGEPSSVPIGVDDLCAIRHAAQTIDRLAAGLATMRLGELVRSACEAFDFDLTLATQGPEGARAWGNVLKIARYAEAFEHVESADPAEFVEYLKMRDRCGSDKAAPAQAGDDAVRIMTIHAAKGLEFPVVFVADLASAHSRAPERVLVRAGDVDGETVPVVGVKLPKERFEDAATPTYLNMVEDARQRDADEEKRCLYVACTRAQELLVLSGCCDLGKSAEQGKTLIDWVRQSLPDTEDDLIEVGGVAVRVTRRTLGEQSQAAPRSEPALPAGPLCAEASPCPSCAEPATVPKTVSFSALSRYETCPLSFVATDVLGLKAFSEPDVVATTFGSAVHAALQSCDLQALDPGRRDAVAVRFRLDEGQVGELEGVVAAFLTSDLAARARAADRFAAEVPINVPLGRSTLVGSIDLIAWQGSSALIVDYKTGAASDGCDANRERAYRLQAECYALAALRAGASSVEVVFAFLQHPGENVALAFTPSDAERIHDRLVGLLQTSAENAPSHLPGYEHRACSACPALGRLCPIQAPRGRRGTHRPAR